MTDLQDSFGAPTAAGQDALPGINDFAEGFIGYQPRSVNVLETAEQAPDCALANIYAGCLWMFLERPEGAEKAAPYLQRARQARHVHERERGLIAMLQAWHDRDFRQAADHAEQLLTRWPCDLVTLKLAQYHRFNLGDAAGMLRMALNTGRANSGRAPFYSMLAFGHEQCHHIDAAERAAMQALDIDATEPWAHHAMAHVHLTRGSVDEGHRFLTSVASTWAGLNSFMFTHNWWHLALFEIAAGKPDAALTLYDQRCWGVQPDYSQDQIGAVSLLARLECAGVDVEERWEVLRPYLETRADDVIQPFLSLQYLYGLARAGSACADELFALMAQQLTEPQVTADRKLWEEVAFPAAQGVLAQARGDHERAAERLSSVQTRLWRIGGSHAQRDLFDQLLLASLLGSEQWNAAQQMIELRRQYEPDNPLLHRTLGRVHEALGLPAASPWLAAAG